MQMPFIAVVVPCHRVSRHILQVLGRIGDEVDLVVVVDDACPEHSGQLVRAQCRDPRVVVLHHEINQGVGGAVLTGYAYAIAVNADIIVKVDGDGQMDPALIPLFTDPIRDGKADYTKGNRFYNVEDLKGMPWRRLAGNAILSFLTKASSGYWTIFDPTNGYTAISALVFAELSSRKIKRRYFFESDMLFRLGTVGARIVDIPMTAVYEDETSGLNIRRILPQFAMGHVVNLGKRLVYSYVLRDFSLASLQLVLGSCLLCFGVIFGLVGWTESVRSGIPASTGTVMLAALPVILGVQFLLSFLAYDIAAVPDQALHPRLASRRHRDPRHVGRMQADLAATLLDTAERRRRAA